MAEGREYPACSCSGRPPSCPQISEVYVVRRETNGRDKALKSCLRLPVLQIEATDAITGQR